MTCPKCNAKARVIETRCEDDYVRRRRVCSECNYRFFTVEIDEDFYERLANAKEGKNNEKNYTERT